MSINFGGGPDYACITLHSNNKYTGTKQYVNNPKAQGYSGGCDG